LLPTPPRGDAVTFGYGVVAFSGMDFHHAIVAPSWAHSYRRDRRFIEPRRTKRSRGAKNVSWRM